MKQINWLKKILVRNYCRKHDRNFPVEILFFKKNVLLEEFFGIKIVVKP